MGMVMTKHAFGYIPDPIDLRDHPFVRAARVARPDHVDLRKSGGIVFDQGQLGSCVLNAVVGSIADHQPGFIGSRLWAYYKTRVRMGTTHEDSGATARAALTTVHKLGLAPEPDWPYDPGKFTISPPHKANTDAKHEVIDGYERIGGGLDAMLDALAMGKDFVIGLALFDSFESDAVAANGQVPMPQHGEGGPYYHEVRGVGYAMKSRQLICRNSWSDQWGDHGDFYLPFDYAADPKLTLDVWSITHCAAA